MIGMFAILALVIGFLLLANEEHVGGSPEAMRAQVETQEAVRHYAASKRQDALAEVMPTPTYEAARWRSRLDSLEHD
jgi:hypothetical protein